MCNTEDETNERNIKISDLEDIIYIKNKELIQLKAQVTELKNERKKICIENHREHWETRRESGLYGEKYNYCHLCEHEI